MEMDDVWQESDTSDNTNGEDLALAQKDFVRMGGSLKNNGYRDGIEEGKEATLQEGFNNGYVSGVNRSLYLGRLRGVMSALKHSPLSSSLLSDKEKGYELCNLERTLANMYQMCKKDCNCLQDKDMVDEVSRKVFCFLHSIGLKDLAHLAQVAQD